MKFALWATEGLADPQGVAVDCLDQGSFRFDSSSASIAIPVVEADELVTTVVAGSEADVGLDQIAAQLATRTVEANTFLVRGDIAAYRSFITLSDDFTLMSPLGGKPTRGERYDGRAMGHDGPLFQGRHRKTGGYPDLQFRRHGGAGLYRTWDRRDWWSPNQAWPLRVTLVYRRDGSNWQLAHRHADPLVKDISLKEVAALARR